MQFQIETPTQTLTARTEREAVKTAIATMQAGETVEVWDYSSSPARRVQFTY